MKTKILQILTKFLNLCIEDQQPAASASALQQLHVINPTFNVKRKGLLEKSYREPSIILDT